MNVEFQKEREKEREKMIQRKYLQLYLEYSYRVFIYTVKSCNKLPAQHSIITNCIYHQHTTNTALIHVIWHTRHTLYPNIPPQVHGRSSFDSELVTK